MKLTDLFERQQKVIWTKHGDKVTKQVINNFVIPNRRKFELIKAESEPLEAKDEQNKQ